MEIEIYGRHTLLFDDDAMAAFVNSEDALVEWNSLLIDRYDVRHLLSSPPPSRRRRNPQTSHSSSADAEIDYERYLDLPPPSEEEEEEADAKPEPVGGFNAVPFSYENNDESNDQKNTEAESEVPQFNPPFPVPENLVQNLPPTEKVHQIISRTALFVSKNGGQSEIILRVKQGNNPTFGFLMPDHHLHPYFRFLVNHKHLLKSNQEKTSDSGALSLLGSTYGEDNEEDDDDNNNNNNKTELPSVSKQPFHVKEDDSISKKNATTSSMKKGESSSSTSSSVSVSAIRASSLPPIHKTENMVLDPPSDMKQLVDKIVEFIIKNGRQFEGVLMEQDRGHGRFPFLIPNNIFHTYYLKVLQKAQESKLTVKSFHKDNEGFRGHNHINKKTSNSKETEKEKSLIQSEDIPFDSDKKEKFKMVINKPKKEASDSESKPSQEQQHSVQVDAVQAAAILQAATRGIKPPNLGFLNGKIGGQNETDSNEQKLKAERLKRAKLFVAMLKSGSAPARGGSVDPQGPVEQKVKSENEHLDDEKYAKRKYRDRDRIHDDDGGDDDDDEKRSRRHREKKRGSHESEERQRKRHRSHSRDDVDKKEEKDKKSKKKHRSRSPYEEKDERSRRKHRSRSSDEEDGRSRRKHRSWSSDEEEDEHSRRKQEKDTKSRKKHRSRSPDEEEDEHSRRKHRSWSSDEEDEHSRRKQEKDKKSKRKHRSRSPDEEEDEHSRRKHRSHKSSSHKHRKSHSSRHKHKHDGKGSVSEEGEEVSLKLSGSHQDQRPQSGPLETTDVPDELRAKIRAMLMSTM